MTIEVEHVVIESTKPAAEVQASLEASLPALDTEVSTLINGGPPDRLRERLEQGPTLSIFLKRNHGAILTIYGEAKNAVQYEIGNPLTASSMTRYELGAGLYAPLRVIIYDKDGGGSRIEYDLPSSLFGQFGDDRVTEVGKALDEELGRALTAAARS